jgi:nitrate reductase alpha subunit
VTTVLDLTLATYGVARGGLPGDWPEDYDHASAPYTPACRRRSRASTAGWR